MKLSSVIPINNINIYFEEGERTQLGLGEKILQGLYEYGKFSKT